MNKNWQIFVLLLLAVLAVGCTSIPPKSVELPNPPKPPRPEVLDQPIPAPLYFQTRLQAIFDSLQPTPTK